uniref:Glycosyltransferase family 92 protein n=1 Tax=Caenorhabditis tropicalis TaxID=1561998 RepID=A0A1I7T7K7_9PELO
MGHDGWRGISVSTRGSFILIIFFIKDFRLLLFLSTREISDNILKKLEKVREDFLRCITPIVNQWRGKPDEMFANWIAQAATCDTIPAFETLGVIPFANIHEEKWAVLPKCKEENTLVTLGVGHDTIAEEKFNRTVPNTVFYGADPIIEPNRQMYSAFGKFFPFAIGRNPGFTNFRVLPNQNQKTRNYVRQDRIDFAWIDIEGGEFEFLDQLHNDVKICQLNMEVHKKFREKDSAQIFHDFILRILEDKKYIFMKSLYTDIGVHRMFFLNLEDRECVAKFFA